MTVFCLGSINIDHVYRLTELPLAGETLSARDYRPGLGGKGINQSIAAKRAGATVVHIGAVGEDDLWITEALSRHGIGMGCITTVPVPTGHAIVAVDDRGENQIIIYSGANLAQDPALIAAALAQGQAGDILLLQNETSHQVEAATLARKRGMKVFYSAAPFALEPLLAVLPQVTHLLVNAGEGKALVEATGTALDALPVEAVIVTHGASGAEWIVPGRTPSDFQPAFSVTPVDTTGAGDCFAGSLAAALDRGETTRDALRYAAAAAALQVTRPGAAPAMPERAEVEALLAR